jgi:energy-coupling factor transporter transmembrane protein EcfT
VIERSLVERAARTRRKPGQPRLGTPAYGAVFLGTLILVMLVPSERLLPVAFLSLMAGLALHPQAVRRLFRWRWLPFAAFLMLPGLLWPVETGGTILGAPLSFEGLIAGAWMVLRAAVVIVAVDGFAGSVDVVEVAGIFERAGLRGLGFAMGVAVNLLPSLRSAFRAAWHTLQMRGGLRRHRARSMRLLIITVIGNALRRAEEIAIAAEGRAYDPESARPSPLKHGRYDRWIVLAVLVVVMFFLVGAGGLSFSRWVE